MVGYQHGRDCQIIGGSGVSDFLIALNLKEYVAVFKEQQIDGMSEDPAPTHISSLVFC